MRGVLRGKNPVLGEHYDYSRKYPFNFCRKYVVRFHRDWLKQDAIDDQVRLQLVKELISMDIVDMENINWLYKLGYALMAIGFVGSLLFYLKESD